MRVAIDGYIWNRRKSVVPPEAFAAEGIETTGPSAPDWTLAWGRPKFRGRGSVIESGFFWNALHIDRGIYQDAALNTPEGLAEIAAYRAPRAAWDIVRSASVPQSKYKQRGKQARWDGVVLGLQRPKDRSTNRVGTAENYYAFVEGACAHYGKHLYLKEHPSGGSESARWREIAGRHGCTVGKVDHSVIERCRFVLVYCSTFAVDCFLRGVRVAQFAPGYFWRTGAVTYTDGAYPDDCADTTPQGSHLADFLIWRYCFDKTAPNATWAKIVARHATSAATFPLTEDLSYAAAYTRERIA